MPPQTAPSPAPETPRQKSLRQREETEQELQQRLVEENRRQAERETALRSSFPAKARELLLHVEASAAEGNSKEFAADCAAHNEAVGKLLADVDATVDALREVLVGIATSDDPSAIFAAIEEFRVDKPALLQRIVKAWNNKVELQQRKEAELHGLPEKLEAKAKETVERVKAQLTEIGSGIEATTAYHVMGHAESAGQRQFDFFARQNVHAAAAIAAAKDAHQASVHAIQEIYRAQDGARAAIQALRNYAAAAVAN